MQRTSFLIALVLALLFLSATGYSQTYTLATQVLSNGATNSANASYSLQGTLQQSVIRLTKSGSYQLQQGFWRYALSYYPCCIGRRGNVNNDEQQIIDLSDLSFLQSYLTTGSPMPACYDEANVNGAGIIDLADLSVLQSYLTGGGYVIPNCP